MLEEQIVTLEAENETLERVMQLTPDQEASVDDAVFSGRITVVSATYGGNCSQKTCKWGGKSMANAVASGNVTGHTAAACNGRKHCVYEVDYFDPDTFASIGVIADPVYRVRQGLRRRVALRRPRGHVHRDSRRRNERRRAWREGHPRLRVKQWVRDSMGVGQLGHFLSRKRSRCSGLGRGQVS